MRTRQRRHLLSVAAEYLFACFRIHDPPYSRANIVSINVNRVSLLWAADERYVPILFQLSARDPNVFARITHKPTSLQVFLQGRISDFKDHTTQKVFREGRERGSGNRRIDCERVPGEAMYANLVEKGV